MLNVTEKMERLHKIAERNPLQIRKSLWKLLVKPEWLAQAWEEIRRNKGSQTAGVDNTTAVDVDLDLINKLAQQLKDGTYRPTPVRRVLIPKANGKTRPLGIPTIKDRIVQQAVKMLLEPIFEADFYNCSHGFRQGKSAITALRDVTRAYPSTSWVIEGDIKGCFDNIPHGKLLQLIGKCIADEKVLSLIRHFLKAGYMEDWKYHKTFSGTPQGGVLSPLLANIFLHQLDDFMMKELEANQIQTKKESNSRRNPEYRKIENKITRLRRQLKEGDGGRETIKEIKEMERQRRDIPHYAKDKKRSDKVWYIRYADDFIILVAGDKTETETIKDKVKNKLSDMGLELSEEKTKLTHWSKSIIFLGYQIQGKQRAKGVGIRSILSIPNEKVKNVKENLEKIGSYYHIPEVDVMNQLNAIYRGWCNYYRYANHPQPDFNKLASKTWWIYAHFNAKKQKSSIKAMIIRARKAGRDKMVKKGRRERRTFQLPVGKKTIFLDIFPPKTEKIWSVTNKQSWTVDLKPLTPLNWQSGRSLATRLEAIERANGVCERCNENPVANVHHTIPIRAKSFLARVMSDRDQRYTAKALCKKCHLEVHGGSFKMNKQKSNVNAGCRESGLSGVGSAVEKPTNES